MVEERGEEQNRNSDNVLVEQYLAGVTIPNHNQKYPQVPTSHDKEKDSEKKMVPSPSTPEDEKHHDGVYDEAYERRDRSD
jgi:hypothetical protein